jgi:Rrf2 family protein
MMVALAKHCGDGEFISASQLVRDGNISYEVGRKLLQKLRDAKLVKSIMGSAGGFKLNRAPSMISLMEIITALQGKIYMNKCLADDFTCQFEADCQVNTKLAPLQQLFANYLESVTIEEILQSKAAKSNKAKNEN